MADFLPPGRSRSGEQCWWNRQDAALGMSEISELGGGENERLKRWVEFAPADPHGIVLRNLYASCAARARAARCPHTPEPSDEFYRVRQARELLLAKESIVKRYWHGAFGSRSLTCRAFRMVDDVLTFFMPPPPFIQ